MRVLQLHTRYRDQGGEETVVARDADLLRARGHEVVQFQLANPEDPVRAALALAVAPWNPVAARSLGRLAKRVRPDVAHLHNTWFAMSPAVVNSLSRLGVPLVLTCHNYRLLCANGLLSRGGSPCEDCVSSHPWHGVRHGCYRRSRLQSVPAAATIALHRRLGTWADQVDVLLVSSQFSRSRFISAGHHPDRVLVRSSFVPDPGGRPRAASASSTVLYVGRLSPEKGVDLLVEAWARAQPSGLELVIIGDGPMRAELERRAGPDVRLVGHLSPDEVRWWMLRARALAVPSRVYENQPTAAVEALAAGLPVLGSDLGTIPEVLGPLGPAWLVTPGLPGPWAASFSRLGDAAQVDRASREAREAYERLHTEAVVAGILEDAYGSARRLRSSRRPAADVGDSR